MKIINLITAAAIAFFSVAFVSSAAFADFLPGETTQSEQVDSFDRVVSFLLSDRYVASRLELRKLSTDIVADLIEVATSSNQSNELRARSIECLALYGPDARVQATLTGLLDSLRTNHRLYPDVIMAFAISTGEEGVSRLEELANYSQSQIRLAAVIALGRFGGQAGYELLHELAISEQDDAVQNRIQSYVR